MVELTNKASIASAAASSKLSIIDFYADWCGPCKMLATFLHDEVKKHSSNMLSLYKANVDTLDISEVTIGCKKIQITSLPTVVFCKNGAVLDVVVGANKAAIQQAIQKYM